MTDDEHNMGEDDEEGRPMNSSTRPGTRNKLTFCVTVKNSHEFPPLLSLSSRPEPEPNDEILIVLETVLTKNSLIEFITIQFP